MHNGQKESREKQCPTFVYVRDEDEESSPDRGGRRYSLNLSVSRSMYFRYSLVDVAVSDAKIWGVTVAGIKSIDVDNNATKAATRRMTWSTLEGTLEPEVATFLVLPFGAIPIECFKFIPSRSQSPILSQMATATRAEGVRAIFAPNVHQMNLQAKPFTSRMWPRLPFDRKKARWTSTVVHTEWLTSSALCHVWAP